MNSSRPDDPPTVLVVEDESLLRIDAVEILEEYGFLTLQAATADAALILLAVRASDVRVLFTDIQMPGTLDGLGLAHHARARWPHIQLIVTSGRLKPHPDDMPGRARFLPKPYRTGDLIIHVRELLQADNG